MPSLPSIDLSVYHRLKGDAEYRKSFFLAEASANIARQLIALRERRGLSQTELAKRLGTQQPAVSRVESADYRNWSFNTLRRIAETMDARIRVVIEPAEDILFQYAMEDAATQPSSEKTLAAMRETKPDDTLSFGQRVPSRTLVAGTDRPTKKSHTPKAPVSTGGKYGIESNRKLASGVPYPSAPPGGPDISSVCPEWTTGALSLPKVPNTGRSVVGYTLVPTWPV